MEGECLVGNYGASSLNHWKVNNPYTSNNIIQMRSAGFQKPFYAGAMATIPYFLGLEHNNAIEHRSEKSHLTEVQKVILAKR